MNFLLHDLLLDFSLRAPEATALRDNNKQLGYATLRDRTEGLSAGLVSLGLQRAERVGIWMEKRAEVVETVFATSLAGGAFVPINPLLKPLQVAHILQDCGVGILVTTAARIPSYLELATHDKNVLFPDSEQEIVDALQSLQNPARLGTLGKNARH